MKRPILPLITADIVGFLTSFILANVALDQFGLYPHNENLFGLSSALSTELTALYVLTAIVGILLFNQQGHYRLVSPWWEQVRHICVFSFLALLTFGFFFYVQKEDTSRLFVISSWVGIIPALMIMRQSMKALLSSAGAWSIPTIIVGGWENAIETVYALQSESYLPYDIQVVVLPNATPTQIKKFKAIHEGIDVKKALPDINENDFVVLCPDNRRELEMGALITHISESGADFSVVPPIEGFSYYGLKPHYFFGYNIVLMRPAIELKSLLNRVLKTLMDRVGAAIGLLILSPVFLYVAYKIKKDGGPAFFGHTRLGKDGKTFKCWKFRSMIINSQEVLEELLANDPEAKAEWDKDFKLKNDPRITKIGHFIRKTSLDEIPQLVNVLKGEMSLVGPRPIVEDETKYYGDKMKDYYSVRPGVTGLWQVSGRNDVTYDQRVYLDSWYVRHWSAWADIVIIIKTIFVVILKRGAY